MKKQTLINNLFRALTMLTPILMIIKSMFDKHFQNVLIEIIMLIIYILIIAFLIGFIVGTKTKDATDREK